MRELLRTPTGTSPHQRSLAAHSGAAQPGGRGAGRTAHGSGAFARREQSAPFADISNFSGLSQSQSQSELRHSPASANRSGMLRISVDTPPHRRVKKGTATDAAGSRGRGCAAPPAARCSLPEPVSPWARVRAWAPLDPGDARPEGGETDGTAPDGVKGPQMGTRDREQVLAPSASPPLGILGRGGPLPPPQLSVEAADGDVASGTSGTVPSGPYGDAGGSSGGGRRRAEEVWRCEGAVAEEGAAIIAFISAETLEETGEVCLEEVVAMPDDTEASQQEELAAMRGS